MFQSTLNAAQDAIGNFLADQFGKLAPHRLTDGMRYATAGGKRLRGFLALETGQMFDVPRMQTLHTAAAVECLHAYSLVHDDLPCMDNDDLRRGQPTVHVKWDEATAILVGDALHTYAFELLTRGAVGDANQRVALISGLARAAGADGMVWGQAQDIAAETTPKLGLADIVALQRNKTGRLIEWAAESGAILGKADPKPLRDYGAALGLAFQIMDDVLDVEGNAKTVGKSLRKDAAAGKATFVSLLGVDAAKTRAKELVKQAETALDAFGDRANALRGLVRYVITRDK